MSSLKADGVASRLKNIQQDEGRSQSGMAAQFYLRAGSKPAQLVVPVFCHEESRFRKIIFGCDLEQPVII